MDSSIVTVVLSGLGALAVLGITKWREGVERNIASRKHVYFEACDALAEIQIALSNFPQRLMKDNIGDPRLTASIMRLHIMGGYKLVKHIMDFQSMYAEIIIDLGVLKLEIENIENKCEHARTSRDEFLNYQKTWIDKLTETTNTEERTQIQGIIDEWKQRIDKCTGYLDENLGKVEPLKIELMEKTFNRSIELAEYSPKCMLEMRKELGLAFNTVESQAYIQECKQGRIKVKGHFDKFLGIMKPRFLNDVWPDFVSLDQQ